jgi:flavin-dependent dehydrogenase
LLDLLRRDTHLTVSENIKREPSEPTFDWHIYANSGPRQDVNNSTVLPARKFGQRYAMSIEVMLSDDSSCQTSFIEATPGGWLFLAPIARGRAVLQAVVPEKPTEIDQTTRELLAHTKELKRIVQKVVGGTAMFECAPKKTIKMDGATWLATGTAACSYDPLCGDGAGYAMRAAILAAAVLEGIDRGGSKESLLSYYKLRLTYAFYTHVRSCLSIYSAANLNESWREELTRMAQGLCEVEQELSSMTTNPYRLNGFELMPLGS